MLLLVVHIVLGFRRLRGLDYYCDDPLVARVCGVRKLPDVATVSRTLTSFDDESVENLGSLIREMVVERLKKTKMKKLTVDFDGSVQSTGGHAEGTAVGFNKKKKGARSYYPLFATVAQVSQFYGRHHRPGNVHDSNGAADFIAGTLYRLAKELPGVQLESRIDSAFYDKNIFHVLDGLDSKFTCSLPFERFPKFKSIIEARRRWGASTRTYRISRATGSPTSGRVDTEFSSSANAAGSKLRVHCSSTYSHPSITVMSTKRSPQT